MRPLLVFMFLLSSVIAAVFLFAAWFEWSMADFDCVTGYLECRKSWLRGTGPWVLGVVVLWLSGAIWLFKTRKTL